MADSANEVIKGIVTRLKAVTAVTDIVSTRIYSSAPQGVTYPFIVVTAQSEDFSTKDYASMKQRVRVQAFSRYNGSKQVLDVRAAVETALNRQEANVTVTGFSLVRLERATLATAFLEGDGKTWQSVIEFDAVTQPS